MIDGRDGDDFELVDELDRDEREVWKPGLARPIELTPRPEIERAMPVLGIFRGLLGRRHVPYKVAIVGDLAFAKGTRWRMCEVTQRIDWLKSRTSLAPRDVAGPRHPASIRRHRLFTVSGGKLRDGPDDADVASRPTQSAPSQGVDPSRPGAPGHAPEWAPPR